MMDWMRENWFDDSVERLRGFVVIINAVLMALMVIGAIVLIISGVNFFWCLGGLLVGLGSVYVASLWAYSWCETAAATSRACAQNAQMLKVMQRMADDLSKLRDTQAPEVKVTKAPETKPEPSTAINPQQKKDQPREVLPKSVNEIVDYAAKYSTVEGARSYLSYKAKEVTDAEVHAQLQTILARSDEKLQEWLDAYRRTK